MPGEFETEAEDVRVRARQDATTLADARGALAQRPRVLVEARDRNDFHDRARLADLARVRRPLRMRQVPRLLRRGPGYRRKVARPTRTTWLPSAKNERRYRRRRME